MVYNYLFMKQGDCEPYENYHRRQTEENYSSKRIIQSPVYHKRSRRVKTHHQYPSLLPYIDPILQKVQQLEINKNMKSLPTSDHQRKKRSSSRKKAIRIGAIGEKQVQMKDKNIENRCKHSSIKNNINFTKKSTTNEDKVVTNLEQILKNQRLKNTDKRKFTNKYDNIKAKFLQIHEDPSRKRLFPTLKSSSQQIPQLQGSQTMKDYRIISHIGKGCFSVVSSAINKNNNKKYAIKTYVKTDQMESTRIESIKEQVNNLFELQQHENIISLRHAVQDGKKIQLIMENGGKQSLAGVLRKQGKICESKARFYFKQIVSAISYCHEKSICHRDIKLQNILIDCNDKIKVIDFGFSSHCRKGCRFTVTCGTPPFMSPQLCSGTSYNGMAADIWALGVCLYLMLTGKFPFAANHEKQLFRLIKQGKFKTNGHDRKLPYQAKDLISEMLKINENERITAKEIFKSKWMKDYYQ